MKRRAIKCVVWDLDDTLWEGTLLEDGQVRLRQDVAEIIRALDQRGVVHSIASRNDEETARAQLRAFCLDEYFLCPQIGWGAKSASVAAIAQTLNIGLDSVCFVDDQPFELAEVGSELPGVLCLSALDSAGLLQLVDLAPSNGTQESSSRRQMYQSEEQRRRLEEQFVGAPEEFLASLHMVLTISRAGSEDLTRAEELTNRTSQLNATGHTFSVAELGEFRCSPHHLLLMGALADKFGSYGKIGLALIECQPEIWRIKQFLVSCRVMNRGTGTVMLNHILRRARTAKVRVLAEFVENGRNRVMYVTYKFAGFAEVEVKGHVHILEHSLANLAPPPSFLIVKAEF
jgi:FkbH-like protein